MTWRSVSLKEVITTRLYEHFAGRNEKQKKKQQIPFDIQLKTTIFAFFGYLTGTTE